MKKILLLVSLFMGFGYSQLASAQQGDDSYVHCLVLDKTLSMTGHGGTDIWNDVQDYCYGWVDGVSTNSTVLFFTFDKNLYGPQEFVIKSESDKQKVKDAIRNVVVDGRYTWIASNLEKAYTYVYDNDKYQGKKQIYLITDGKEEQQGSDFAKVMQGYSVRRGDYDHLYYVDLRDQASQETREIFNNTPGTEIGSGFMKFTTVNPVFTELNAVIGMSNMVEQYFTVKNIGEAASIPITCKVSKIENVGDEPGVANVTITPSIISIANMEKVDDNTYKCVFTIDFINNSTRECNVYVSLSSKVQNETQITFAPEDFCIKARNKGKGVVTVKKSWHTM